MEPSDWVSSSIAFGALVVAVIALYFSAKSATSAQSSASASELSALVSKRQHVHELARDGITEFGPWRAEAHDVLNWRLINTGSEVLYDLYVAGDGYGWEVQDGEAVDPQGVADSRMPGGAGGKLSYQVTVSWRTVSPEGPEVSEVVWLHRRGRRLGVD